MTDSSLLLSSKHVLHVISFLNIYICCACKDPTQNLSKLQRNISAASSCWKSEKLCFPDLLPTPHKNCKNWGRSKRDLKGLNNDILTKENINRDSELLQKVRFDHNCCYRKWNLTITAPWCWDIEEKHLCSNYFPCSTDIWFSRLFINNKIYRCLDFFWVNWLG